jgi:hypothetical protein
MWEKQHEPILLENGNILLFDNLGHRGRSKVIEFDPFTQSVSWTYEGDPTGGFFSNEIGSNQRLPNGNTLITDSETGEAFEVTSENVVVWKYRSPYRAGENGEFVATLLEVRRLESDPVRRWLSDE